MDEPPTLPLSDSEYNKLLKIIPSSFTVKKGKRVHAVIRLMRFSGLAIRDAVTLERDEIQHDKKQNLYRITTSRQKTGTHVSVPIPPDVAAELLEVMKLNKNPRYIFWNTGNGTVQSAVGKWHVSLKEAFVAAEQPDGHPHQLRDTFAVSLLQKGVPMEEVSKLLGHASIRTTEKHYSPWVTARQDRLDTLVVGTWS